MCGKFNPTDCSLKVDDNGKAVTATATYTRKIAHVPIESYKVWDPGNLFGDGFSTLGGSKIFVRILPLLLRTCLLLLSCLLLLVLQSATSLLEAIVERKTAVKSLCYGGISL